MAALFAPFDQLQEILGFAAFLAAGVAAIAFGSTPVRLAGVVQLVDGFGVTLAGALAHGALSFLTDDVKGLIVWSVYLVMTLRWSGRWLIGLTALQGLAVLVRASFWLDADLPRAVTALILNLTGWAMVFILVAATMVHSRRRSSPVRPSQDG